MLLKKNHHRASDFRFILNPNSKGPQFDIKHFVCGGGLSGATTDPVVAEACRRRLEIFQFKNRNMMRRNKVLCKDIVVIVLLRCEVFPIPMLTGDTIIRTTQRRNQDTQTPVFRIFARQHGSRVTQNFPNHQISSFFSCKNILNN
jgi:hypothetical protein